MEFNPNKVRANDQVPDEAGSEADLIYRWVEDSCENAARELIERFHPRIASIIRQRHAQSEDWPDLEQETLTRIFQNLHRYRPEKPLEHWISRITLNVCRECWRKRSSRNDLRWADLGKGEQLVLENAGDEGDDGAAHESRDSHRLLLRMMEQLDPTDRAILSLLYLEGLTSPEAAKRLGMSKVAVRVRSFRAKKKLEDLWKRLGDDS